MTSSIIDEIHQTLLTLLKESSDSGSFADKDPDLKTLSQCLAETPIDSDEGGSGITDPSRLTLKPPFDDIILQLLALVSLGKENAIAQLADLLLTTDNPNLVRTVAKLMDKGIPGAEAVLSEVSNKANGEKREKVRRIVDEVNPSLSAQLNRPSISPFKTPTPTPR